MHTFWSR